MAIASDLSLVPSPTPTQSSPIRGWSAVPYFLKEAVGVGLGRIIGFNHLEWLHDDLTTAVPGVGQPFGVVAAVVGDTLSARVLKVILTTVP